MKLNTKKYTHPQIIKIIREWTELTQKEFGESIGKKERSIQHYEQGSRRYSFETFSKICKVHDIDIILIKNTPFK